MKQTPCQGSDVARSVQNGHILTGPERVFLADENGRVSFLRIEP